MKRLFILVALILVSLVVAGTVYALPPSGIHIDMGDDITITLISAETRRANTIEDSVIVFDVVATYYISGSRDIELAHTSGIIDADEAATAAAESGISGKLRKVAELIMLGDSRFNADLLKAQIVMEDYAIIVNGWLSN